MQTWCLTSLVLSGRVELSESRHGLKPDWGKPTVRNFRGGAGNVSDGRIRTPLHRSKEWNMETLGLRLRAPVLYSTGSTARRKYQGTRTKKSPACFTWRLCSTRR